MEISSSFGFFSWIIFGALAGWAASLLAGTRDSQGCLTNIIVGIIGAFIGGAIFAYIGDSDGFYFNWSAGSFAAAVVGSLILLGILRLAGRR
ncbi:MAG: GlsB/YeaQ/YmgE family stress response membrane protein [Thermomicrobiales bacterium]